MELATLADVDYLCHLQRIEANREDSIGFIPRLGYEREVMRGNILIARENGDSVGFIYATHNRAGVTRIQQLAVQDDARRLEIGTQLVTAVTKANDWLISLRCRANLPAVTFWEELMFKVTSVDATPTKRKQPVLRFQKVVGGLWIGDQGRAITGIQGTL